MYLHLSPWFPLTSPIILYNLTSHSQSIYLTSLSVSYYSYQSPITFAPSLILPSDSNPSSEYPYSTRPAELAAEYIRPSPHPPSIIGLISLPLISQYPLKTRLRNRISHPTMVFHTKGNLQPFLSRHNHSKPSHSYRYYLLRGGPKSGAPTNAPCWIKHCSKLSGHKTTNLQKCDSRDKAAYLSGTYVSLSSAGGASVRFPPLCGGCLSKVPSPLRRAPQ